MSGSGHWDGEAAVGVVSAQVGCLRWYGSCVVVGYH